MPEPAHHRRQFLRRVLAREKKLDWPNTNTSLAELKKTHLKVDIAREILRHRHRMRDPNYVVLEAGAGLGRAANELHSELNSQKITSSVPIKIIATGLKLRPEWQGLPNYKHIDWKRLEFEQLAQKIPHTSVNFVYSNFGFSHAQDMVRALTECGKILKKGGRILFSYDKYISAPPLVPAGFKPVRKSAAIYEAEPSEHSQKVHVVVYLEKV